jgi:hypothetical protein
MQTCRICKEHLSLEKFPQNKSYKTGKATVCKPCSAKLAFEYRNPIREAERKYNLSKNQVLELKARTECEICGNINIKNKALCIDHNHITGQVRGVLCDACNTGIGKLRDDVTLLQQAINYLNKYAKQN